MPGIKIEEEHITPREAVEPEWVSELEISAAVARNANIELEGEPQMLVDEAENDCKIINVDNKDIAVDMVEDNIKSELVTEAGMTETEGDNDSEPQAPPLLQRDQPPDMLDADSSDDEDSDNEEVRQIADIPQEEEVSQRHMYQVCQDKSTRKEWYISI